MTELADEEAIREGNEVAMNLEEVFWKEKVRLNWNLLGVRNTKFFHTYAKIKNKSKII